jgi:hypothetical protein
LPRKFGHPKKKNQGDQFPSAPPGSARREIWADEARDSERR